MTARSSGRGRTDQARRVEGPAVGELDLEPGSAAHDVRVGDHVPLRVIDDSRPEPLIGDDLHDRGAHPVDHPDELALTNWPCRAAAFPVAAPPGGWAEARALLEGGEDAGEDGGAGALAHAA